MVRLFSLFLKLSIYLFWRGLNAIHRITPRELDLMGEALTEPLEGLDREQRWSSWSILEEEVPAPASGK